MSGDRRWWPPTRVAVVYVIAMFCLYLATETLGVFGDAGMPVQNVLGIAFVLAAMPTALILPPLYFITFVLAGGSVDKGIPFLTEAMMAITVLLNAVFINWVVGRRQRRRIASL